MNYTFRFIVTNLTVCFAAFIMSGCSSNNAGKEPSNYDKILSNDSIPTVIKNIVKAVYENDPEAFAKEVAYPLQRPYPLKDIQNSEEMKAYYNIVVDDSLRNILINSSPEDWQEYGWRGYSLDDGSYLWVDESIYAIDYISLKERNLIDSLTAVEKNSLPKQIGTGWTPVLTLFSEENGKIYRIDKNYLSSDQAPSYRLSVYNRQADKNDLRRVPDEMIDGFLHVEGSAPIASYVFKDKEGNKYVIYPDDPGLGTPVIAFPDGSEKQLLKAYWYELFQ